MLVELKKGCWVAFEDCREDEFVACIDIKCGHCDDITCEDCIFNNGDRRLSLEEINIKEEN